MNGPFIRGYFADAPLSRAPPRVAPDAPLLAKPFRADALDKAVRNALVHAG